MIHYPFPLLHDVLLTNVDEIIFDDDFAEWCSEVFGKVPKISKMIYSTYIIFEKPEDVVVFQLKVKGCIISVSTFMTYRLHNEDRAKLKIRVSFDVPF